MGNKFKVLILMTAISVFLSGTTVLAESWGLGFPNPGATPVGSDTAEYLENYDSFYFDNSGEKNIYLTFDAGYENGYTEKILDTLKANDVKAAFFLVGNYIKDNPELVNRMIDEGHIIGNHTAHHPDMSKITDPAVFANELSSVEEIFKSVTGKEMDKFYRPPAGKYSEENLKTAKNLGYKTIFWSLAYLDFDNKNQPSREAAFSKLLPRIHPGAVVLLHNTSKTNSEILDELIKKYREMGYNFKSLDNLTGSLLKTGADKDSESTLCLPILMYHKISKKEPMLGEYVVSPAEFESDLKLLKERGFTSITVSDLINYTKQKQKLPEKPVMITFDDGFQSDYVYAFPLLRQHNMKAVFSVVGEYVNKYSQPDIDKHINYAHLSWDEIREMRDSGLAEFQSHTFNLHSHSGRRGALKRKSESKEEYESAMTTDIANLNEAFIRHLGAAPTALTCPFGAYNDCLKEVVKSNGFSAILTSQQKMNKLTGDPEELFHLNRILRPHGMNLQKLVDRWDAEIEASKTSPNNSI